MSSISPPHRIPRAQVVESCNLPGVIRIFLTVFTAECRR